MTIQDANRRPTRNERLLRLRCRNMGDIADNLIKLTSRTKPLVPASSVKTLIFVAAANFTLSCVTHYEQFGLISLTGNRHATTTQNIIQNC